MYRQNCTDAEIAVALKISPATYDLAKRKYAELKEIVKITREETNGEVENALYKRAVGYDYVETTTTEQAGTTNITTKTKHVSGSVAAQIFWLNNRESDRWRKESEAVGDGEPRPFLINITDKESRV